MIVAFDTELINSFSANVSLTVDRVGPADSDSTWEQGNLSLKNFIAFQQTRLKADYPGRRYHVNVDF